MTNLELREWCQHAFVSKLFDMALEFAEHDSLLDAKTLFAQCISFAPHILARMEDLEVSGSIRIAALRGELDYNQSHRTISALLLWDPPVATIEWRVKTFLVRAIISINLFSKSEAEAKCLLWRLIKKMIESFGMRWVREYMFESATKQTLLFGGRTDSPAEAAFEAAQQSEIDRMAELFQLPAIGALV